MLRVADCCADNATVRSVWEGAGLTSAHLVHAMRACGLGQPPPPRTACSCIFDLVIMILRFTFVYYYYAVWTGAGKSFYIVYSCSE